MSYGKVRKMWENDEGTKGNQRQITIYTKVILPEVVWKKLVSLSPAYTKATETKNILLSDKCLSKVFCSQYLGRRLGVHEDFSGFLFQSEELI